MRWMEATAEVFVDRPIQDVFDYTADLSNWDAWVSGVSNVRKTSKGRYGAGTELESDYQYRKTYRITYEVTQFDRPSVHAVKSTSGPFPFEGTVRFRERDAGTVVSNTIRAGSDSKVVSVMWAVGGAPIRWLMRRQLKKELLALKAELEGERD